ncbi:hypothetical protein SERLA73DRAFT_159988 [Serpula lacrymans var. lacrymans S7.3]|uniref:Rpr2-domain-containing protein n=2 Tax=Serpula lacrymans var. lacrymans TaxID=341189 RepID=F8PW04_SERL3|nr:uncharacterized protein SERLADRAFT_415019 [Serpula lacrymans var. lacrymans S7.9]EGN99863.1 hypothetical protein SERLA73DRAFT_159988 [Serpula lacrymans var. lacrymans S7.3]EGO25432.1 hypothetical protein SERLADRAFT_415019 [Serpula lacrymans var. lacrymans S7.9]
MAKKNKDETPNPTSISNRDIIQRLNFLYQASTYLNNISLPPNPDPDPESLPSTGTASATTDKARKSRKEGKNDGRGGRRVVTRSELSRAYVESMRTVGQKTIVKMDPSVKRTVCRGCHIVLLPGLTSKVRVKASRSHGHIVTYICTECKTSRRIPAPPTLLSPVEGSKEAPVIPQEAHAAHAAPEHVQLGQTMDIDHHDASKEDPTSMPASAGAADVTSPAKRRRCRKARKSAVPRLAPHFARKVGHVVFRGNERLQDERASRGDWTGATSIDINTIISSTKPTNTVAKTDSCIESLPCQGSHDTQ